MATGGVILCPKMRFAERWPASDARVRCACGHGWTPSGRNLAGVMRVTCAECAATLAVIGAPRELRIVVEVQRSEWDDLDVTDVGAVLRQLGVERLRTGAPAAILRAAG